MTRATARGGATALAVILAGCATLAAPEEPALLVGPSARVRAELAQAVASEFGGIAVPLADDALTSAPDVAIDRVPARDAEGRLLNGRELGRPEIFRLVRTDGRCVLVHDRTGHRLALPSANCRPR